MGEEVGGICEAVEFKVRGGTLRPWNRDDEGRGVWCCGLGEVGAV